MLQVTRIALAVVAGMLIGCRAAAISVDLLIVEGAYCGQPNGILSTLVTGGVPPYRFDWYIVDGGEVPLCSDCGEFQEGLVEFVTYKVVVTDALSDMAEDQEMVPGFMSVYIAQVEQVPYLAGASPMILVEAYCDGVGGGAAPSIEVTNSYGNTGLGGNAPRFALDPGTTSVTVTAITGLTYAGAQECGVAIEEVTIDPPTILPTITPLNISPSCTNGSSGRIDVALSNGFLPNGIELELKDEFGNELDQHTLNSSSMPLAQRSFTNVGPGVHWLVLTGAYDVFPMDVPGFVYTCRDSIQVNVPSTGASCGFVQGSLFIDANANCTKQANEIAVPNTNFRILPGPYYGTTTATGSYSVQLPAGNYTIQEENDQLAQSCSSVPVPFTVPPSTTPVTVNVPCSSAVAMDVDVSIASGPARPGFELTYAVALNNRTPASSGAITVTVQLDPAITFLASTPAPTTITGNTLVWNQAALTAYQGRSIGIRTQVPANVALLGTDLVTTAVVTTGVTDGAPANNTALARTLVTGSYDPNDKLAMTNSGSTVFFDPAVDDRIDYTIRFQNTGTDTAFTVIITDTLPANLDPATLVMGAYSHPITWQLLSNGTLKIWALNILLPDSNVNEPKSHGFVKFRIKPRLPLVPGSQLINRANIFFDFNPPVITDPSVLVVPVPGIRVAARVLLDGPYEPITQLMNDGLRAAGLLPITEPYSALGYVHAGSGGGEVVPTDLFTISGNDAIVDWVVVELRGPNAPYAVLATRSALLQRDGDVVNTTGSGPVIFHEQAGNYRLALRHRNHLGAMTNAAVALNTSAATVVDLSATSTTTYGANARKAVGSRMVLWSGDSNADGIVRYSGMANDRDRVLLAIGGAIPTNVVTGVYSSRDINLDGTIRYTGANNDRDIILQTIGGSVPTAVRIQQLP